VKRRRDLIVTNLVALCALAAIWLAGWREAVGFGLAILAILNLMVMIREQSARSRDDSEE
jgi:hypothetical protein